MKRTDLFSRIRNTFFVIFSSGISIVSYGQTPMINASCDIREIPDITTEKDFNKYIMHKAGYSIPISEETYSATYKPNLYYYYYPFGNYIEVRSVENDLARAQEVETLKSQNIQQLENLLKFSPEPTLRSELLAKLSSEKEVLERTKKSITSLTSQYKSRLDSFENTCGKYIKKLREDKHAQVVSAGPQMKYGETQSWDKFNTPNWEKVTHCDLYANNILGNQKFQAISKLLAQISIPSFCFLPNVINILRLSNPNTNAYWNSPDIGEFSTEVENKLINLDLTKDNINPLQLLALKSSFDDVNYGYGYGPVPINVIADDLILTFLAQMTPAGIRSIPKKLKYNCNLENTTYGQGLTNTYWWKSKDGVKKQLLEYNKENEIQLSARQQVKYLESLCKNKIDNNTQEIIKQLSPESIIFYASLENISAKTNMYLASSCEKIAENPDAWANRNQNVPIPQFHDNVAGGQQ